MTEKASELKPQFPEIVEFLENLNLNDIKYDGWPVWWFFKWRFLSNRLLSPLPTHKEIMKSVRDNKPIKHNPFLNLALRKFVRYNEAAKIWISRYNKNKSPQTNKNVIMLLTHTNALLPDKEYGYTVDREKTVVNEIRKDPELEEYISSVMPLSHKPTLKLLNYPNPIYSYIDKEIKEKARENSSQLHKEWMELSKELTFDSESDKKLYKAFLPALNLFFSKEMIHIIILYYEAYKKIIREEKIRVICTAGGGSIHAKCAIAACKGQETKVLEIAHGLGAYALKIDQPDNFYIAVVSQKHKETVRGISPDNIFVTGPTFMDNITPYKKHTASNNKKKRILFATTPKITDNLVDEKNYVAYMTKFIKDLNKLSNTEIIIKAHPRETDMGLYRSIASHYDNVIVVTGTDKDQLYPLIRKSDVALTFESSITAEIMAIGTPLIVIDMNPWISNVITINDRARVLHVGRDEDISQIVDKTLNNPDFRDKTIANQNENVRSYLYKVDGKCGKRVVDIIKQLVSIHPMQADKQGKERNK